MEAIDTVITNQEALDLVDIPCEACSIYLKGRDTSRGLPLVCKECVALQHRKTQAEITWDKALALLQPKIEEFCLQIEALDKKLDDREADLITAKREERERIIKWGNEPCLEHSKVKWPDELGGGMVERQKMKRRRCQHCWQALKGGE